MTTDKHTLAMTKPNKPLRPVSDTHRHEPADYEVAVTDTPSDVLVDALRHLKAHAERTHALFRERLGARTRPTWFAVNALQEFVDFVCLWDIYDRLSTLPAAGDVVGGYADAFYDLARLMDIPARAKSPIEVWEDEMRPRLRAALQPPPVNSLTDGEAGDGHPWAGTTFEARAERAERKGDHAGLIEWLNRRAPSKRDFLYGEEGNKLINPDGPEAATALTTLQAEVKELREGLGHIHAVLGNRHGWTFDEAIRQQDYISDHCRLLTNTKADGMEEGK